MENSKIDLEFKNNQKETAYFLGFFWADGTINSGKYLTIEITEEDALSLADIFRKVCNFKITKRVRPNRKPQVTFFIKDAGTATKLTELGKYPNTVETHEKILKFIPKEYVVYFLRGLIDGDGCFYSGPSNNKWKNNTVHFSIAGRYDQDWTGLLDYFTNIGFNIKAIKRVDEKRGNKSSALRASNFSDIENFVNWLYNENDSVFLKRKYDKIFSAIEAHKKNIQESIDRKKKFEITFENGTILVIDNLKKFAKDNGLCYECLSRASNGKHKYKNLKIKQTN